MFLKNWIEKFKNTMDEKFCDRGDIYHYTVHFTTADGKEHIYTKYKYGAPSKLINGNIPKYIMIHVHEDSF